MAQICVNGVRECIGCMMCKEDEPVIYDSEGTPIYEGEHYYEIMGDIIHEDSIKDYLGCFKREARRG